MECLPPEIRVEIFAFLADDAKQMLRFENVSREWKLKMPYVVCKTHNLTSVHTAKICGKTSGGSSCNCWSIVGSILDRVHPYVISIELSPCPFLFEHREKWHKKKKKKKNWSANQQQDAACSSSSTTGYHDNQADVSHDRSTTIFRSQKALNVSKCLQMIALAGCSRLQRLSVKYESMYDNFKFDASCFLPFASQLKSLHVSPDIRLVVTNDADWSTILSSGLEELKIGLFPFKSDSILPIGSKSLKS